MRAYPIRSPRPCQDPPLPGVATWLRAHPDAPAADAPDAVLRALCRLAPDDLLDLVVVAFEVAPGGRLTEAALLACVGNARLNACLELCRRSGEVSVSKPLRLLSLDPARDHGDAWIVARRPRLACVGAEGRPCAL